MCAHVLVWACVCVFVCVCVCLCLCLCLCFYRLYSLLPGPFVWSHATRPFHLSHPTPLRQEEKLEDEDTWYCSKCQEFRAATKQLALWRMPEILVRDMVCARACVCVCVWVSAATVGCFLLLTIPPLSSHFFSHPTHPPLWSI